MPPSITTPSHEAFERTTTKWGSITLFAGFLIATSVPFYLLFVAQADITVGDILTAFLAVFAVYGVFYIVEPLTYYPILGPAGMYQAFMIGNIANKLLPSAIVAQDTIGAKPGTWTSSCTSATTSTRRRTPRRRARRPVPTSVGRSSRA